MKKFVLLVIKNLLLYFWRAHRFLVLRNKKFKNIHAGETCYIFGNGGSLKYYDISKLSKDTPVIVCSYSLIDKRMEALNIKYMVVTDSYNLYPWLYNTYPHVRKFQLNRVRPILKKIMEKTKGVHLFTSLTNLYATLFWKNSLNYVFHFGYKTPMSDDMAGNFSNVAGAADVMLATAKYLGFSKAIVMGCDYFGTPPMLGHFYADYEPFEWSSTDYVDYRARVKVASEGIDVLVILPEGVTSPDFKYDSYENYFGLAKKYQENHEFIDTSDLKMLWIAAKSFQTIMSHDKEE